MNAAQSERALVLAPHGRDAAVACQLLAEAGIAAHVCADLPTLVSELDVGVGVVLVTEEALATANLRAVSAWLAAQPEWSDLPFITLTSRGGGLERNPAAGRYLDILGNVTFLERPFHPTTLVSIARAALRSRRRQYEARARLQALLESDRQFRTLANSIPTLCWMARPDGHVFWYNRQWYAYTGTRPEDMQGWGWQRVHDAAVLPEVVRRWQQSLDTGTPFEMVFPLRGTDGSFRPFLTRVQPVRGADGRIARWFGTSTDISAQQRAEAELRELAADLERRVEERTAERELALAQLHEAQKLETIGQLTGGVAHDFNNLLTPITGTLDLLQHRYGESDPRSARLIAAAQQSAERARTLVQRLLGFARRQALRTTAVDVVALVEGMRDLIASSVGSAIELRLQLEPALPRALADANQLELAILNLCVNARDAMPGGGTLTVAVAGVSLDAGHGPALPAGPYVRLSVVDSGVGMDAETLRRAIEPFFSTKKLGKGTGLGLSMVHGFARQLGGSLELSSAPGAGTRAELWLPATTGATAAPAAHPALVEREQAPGPPLTILLVDDEELVRAGTAEMLRDLGHVVTEASGATQAIAKLADGLQVDAVVTDYVMPGMSGAELVARLRREHPEVPVLVITGYSGLSEAVPDVPQLAKPFRQVDLAATLERLVRGAEPVARHPPPGA